MSNPDRSLDPKILESAMAEFLKHGYEKASTNVICRNAGVTWGALAKRYAGKDALFAALVRPAAEEFKSILKGEYRDFEDMDQAEQERRAISTDKGDIFFLEYVYAHLDEFRLLVMGASGSSYENYLDELVEIIEKTTRNFMESTGRKAMIQDREVDDTTIHILVSAYLYGMFEPIKHNMSKDQAYVYLTQLKYFYDAGWARILGLE